MKQRIVIWARDHESGRHYVYQEWMWTDKYGVHIIIPNSQANGQVDPWKLLREFREWMEVVK